MAADLTLLHPNILPLYNRLIGDLVYRGWIAHAIVTYRTPEQENALPAALTSVTGNTSKHCFAIDGKPASKAFDLGFFEKDGSYVSNGSDQRYVTAGALWVGYGLEFPALKLIWGGIWRKPHDPDHFQIA